ncbi:MULTISPECIES: glycosyltransferase family 2 protein [Spiribacter]|nr:MULTISPECIES: glycosyltransferase family 2 protein [Spiribacter]
MDFVVPVYNEQASIDTFMARLREALVGSDIEYRVVFVNDGSEDRTLDAIKRHRRQAVVIDLSRNFGKEAALTAGLDHADGDVVVPIDVDLQDPPELIPEMLQCWREGAEVVLARRCDRSTDSWFKRNSAGLFYRIHNAVADPSIPANVGDFRLMDRAVVEALRELPEARRFMKGLFAWAGFRTSIVDYHRDARESGGSKFNAWKLWNFAIEGITSFSIAPLRIWTYIGAVTALFAFTYAGFIVVRTLFYGVDVPGYASLLVSVMFLGGIQLIGIGILGEYLGRAYIEAKRRPTYLVRRVYGQSRDTD